MGPSRRTTATQSIELCSERGHIDGRLKQQHPQKRRAIEEPPRFTFGHTETLITHDPVVTIFASVDFLQDSSRAALKFSSCCAICVAVSPAFLVLLDCLEWITSFLL